MRKSLQQGLEMLRYLTFVCSFASVLLAGCANRGSEQYFERSTAAIEKTRASAAQDNRATVYFMRRGGLLQSMALPMPPLFFALDGTMLSVMPIGSHVVLSLEPGNHTFTQIAVVDGDLFPLRTYRKDTTIELAAGKTYFVAEKPSLLTSSLGLVDEATGRANLAETELAKFIHQPVSIQVFLGRLEAAEAKRRAGTSPSNAAPTGQHNAAAASIAALPSSKEVGEFLEVVATVALIAVLLLGAAAGASTPTNASPPNTSSLLSPPAISAPAPKKLSAIDGTWRTSSGTLSEVLNSKSETILRNTSTGVSYRIEDGRVMGTDGSRYRVHGATVFSDSGQTYQVVGNNIMASDGRSCVKTGTVVTCR